MRQQEMWSAAARETVEVHLFVKKMGILYFMGLWAGDILGVKQRPLTPFSPA